MIKVDYNNIWYSFFKATKEDVKIYLINVLQKHNIVFNSLKIKGNYTDWEHSNFNIIFSIDGNNRKVYSVFIYSKIK